jgi:lysophospholipase L1-like esterase
LIGALVTLIAAGAAASAGAATLYVAVGDSVAAGYGASAGHGAFDLYCAYLKSAAGGSVVDQCINESQVAATTESALTGGMISRAVGDINESVNTPVVTIILGGNDLLGSPGCEPITGPDCPFTTNARSILEQLETALAKHPGPHVIKWLEYYNPNHDNQFGDLAADASSDSLLLGSDLAVGDCASDTPEAIGLNDAISCVSAEKGAIAVDAYTPFRTTCAQVPCFSDSLHPNDTGYGLIFAAFRDAGVGPLPPSPPGGPTGSMPPPTTDGTVATVSGLFESKRRFLPSRRHFKGGTVFSLRLDQPAKIGIWIQRLAAGRRVGRRCLPQRPHRAAKRRCTRAIPLGTLLRQGHPGLNKVWFDGRLRGHPLAPGRYLALVTAINPTGSSAFQRLRFIIARRR